MGGRKGKPRLGRVTVLRDRAGPGAEQDKGTADKNMTARVQKIIVNTCSGKISRLNLVCLICITTKALFFYFKGDKYIFFLKRNKDADKAFNHQISINNIIIH